VPVAGGIAFFVLLGLATWGIAALLSRNPQRVTEELAATTFELGDTEAYADVIADSGPILLQGLVGDDAARSIVVDHTGDVADRGWRVYFAHPAEGDPTCRVTQVPGTRRFVDCAGTELAVEDLAPATGVVPIVGEDVIIDLRGATGTTVPGTTAVPASSEG